MKISYKVPLLASFVVTIAFTIFSWIQYNIVQDSLYRKTEQNVEEASTLLAYQITNWLNGKLKLMDMMAETIDGNFSFHTIQETMNIPLLKQEFLLIFGALSTNGRPISNSVTWDPGEGWDARARPWYSVARANRQAVLTEPYAHSATQEILISAVSNFYDNGVFKGAFGGDLSLKTISDKINKLHFNNTGYAFLLNSNGNIISHPNPEINGQNMSVLFTEERPKLTNILQELTVGDKELLVSFKPLLELHGSSWFVGVVLEKDRVFADAYTLGVNAAIGALISALASCLVLYIVMQKLLINPINILITIADEVSRGKLHDNIVETNRNDEVGAMARSVERMTISLKIALKRLRTKNEY